MVDEMNYWSKRWQMEDTPWHLTKVNKFLQKHFDHIRSLKKGPCKIFVPLCGKTFDLKWICDQGHEVVGLDAVEKPILEFFQEQKLDFTRGCDNGLDYFVTTNGKIKIYNCNLFSLSPLECGKFDGIWDRGSLVALHSPIDKLRYSSLLKQMLNENFSYLINTVEYNQSQYAGPPYSVSVEDVKSLYGETCSIEVLETSNTNADPTSPTSAKMRWNVDVCHEVILLLRPKNVFNYS